MSRWGWLHRGRRPEPERTAAPAPSVPDARQTPRDRKIAELRAGIKRAKAQLKAARNDEQQIGPLTDIRTMSEELAAQLEDERQGRIVEAEVLRHGGVWHPTDW